MVGDTYENVKVLEEQEDKLTHRAKKEGLKGINTLKVVKPNILWVLTS